MKHWFQGCEMFVECTLHNESNHLFNDLQEYVIFGALMAQVVLLSELDCGCRASDHQLALHNHERAESAALACFIPEEPQLVGPFTRVRHHQVSTVH